MKLQNSGHMNAAQVTVLVTACSSRRRISRNGKIEPFEDFAAQTDTTVLQVVQTVRNKFFDSAEMFSIEDKIYVIGWSDNNAYAVSPELGNLGAETEFELAPHVIAAARKKLDPAVIRQMGRTGQIVFTIGGFVCLALSLLTYYYQAGVGRTNMPPWMFFAILAALALGSVFVVKPLIDWRYRSNGNRALLQLQSG